MMPTIITPQMTAVERVLEYTGAPTERPSMMPTDPGQAWPDKGEIIFRDLVWLKSDIRLFRAH